MESIVNVHKQDTNLPSLFVSFTIDLFPLNLNRLFARKCLSSDVAKREGRVV